MDTKKKKHNTPSKIVLHFITENKKVMNHENVLCVLHMNIYEYIIIPYSFMLVHSALTNVYRYNFKIG